MISPESRVQIDPNCFGPFGKTVNFLLKNRFFKQGVFITSDIEATMTFENISRYFYFIRGIIKAR